MKTNYENDTLRQEWVDRKRGIGVCHDDNGKKDARPPKLRRVEWQFHDGFEDTDTSDSLWLLVGVFLWHLESMA